MSLIQVNETWYSAHLPATTSVTSSSLARANDQSWVVAMRSTTSTGLMWCSSAKSVSAMPLPPVSLDSRMRTHPTLTRRNGKAAHEAEPGYYDAGPGARRPVDLSSPNHLADGL